MIIASPFYHIIDFVVTPYLVAPSFSSAVSFSIFLFSMVSNGILVVFDERYSLKLDFQPGNAPTLLYNVLVFFQTTDVQVSL